MSAAYWSWIAAGVSIAGLWISGLNPRWGWAFGIATQGVWIAYGLATAQPGMLALSAAFITLYGRNLWRWRHTAFQRATAAEAGAEPVACCTGSAR